MPCVDWPGTQVNAVIPLASRSPPSSEWQRRGGQQHLDP